jgi:Fe2+ transport system protein FeoA
MEKSLSELKEGEKGRITNLIGGFGRGQCRGYGGGAKQLENLGIRIGKEVTVASIQPFGPIVIEIDGRETAIGRGRAGKIYVEI